MNATNKLLDKWIAMRSAKQGVDLRQSAIGLELGVKSTAISNYRSGTSQAAPHVIAKMCVDLGENPAAWLALVESERAKDADDRKTWARVARQLGIAATVAFAVILPHQQATARTLTDGPCMHYVKWRKWSLLARGFFSDRKTRLVLGFATLTAASFRHEPTTAMLAA